MIEPADYYAALQDPWVTAAAVVALLVVGAIALHGAADSARRRRRRGPLPDVQALRPPVHIITETEVLVAYGPVHRVSHPAPHAEAPGREAGPRSTHPGAAR